MQQHLFQWDDGCVYLRRWHEWNRRFDHKYSQWVYNLSIWLMGTDKHHGTLSPHSLHWCRIHWHGGQLYMCRRLFWYCEVSSDRGGGDGVVGMHSMRNWPVEFRWR